MTISSPCQRGIKRLVTDVLALPDQNFKQGASEHDMDIVTGLCLVYTPSFFCFFFFFYTSPKVLSPLSSEVRKGL